MIEIVSTMRAKNEQPSAKESRMSRWLLWTIIAVTCWGIWALLSKVIGDALSPIHSQALSTIGLLPVIAVLAFSRKAPNTGKPRDGVLLAILAGVLTCLGNMAYYQALNRGGKAAMVVPLTALYPIVTVLLATCLLRERLNKVQSSGILVSFVAIYLLNVQDEKGFWSPWLLSALIPIALWGASGFLQKLSTNHVSGELSAVWFLAAFVPVALWILLAEPLPQNVSARTWFLVVALGFFFALGNFALLAAFASNGKASVIAPLAALYPVVSVPIAIVVFGERVGLREMAGIALSLLSAAALSWEKQPREINLEAATLEK
jgi:drug/metabolite transporter (DMT)-like permease